MRCVNISVNLCYILGRRYTQFNRLKQKKANGESEARGCDSFVFLFEGPELAMSSSPYLKRERREEKLFQDRDQFWPGPALTDPNRIPSPVPALQTCAGVSPSAGAEGDPPALQKKQREDLEGPGSKGGAPGRRMQQKDVGWVSRPLYTHRGT